MKSKVFYSAGFSWRKAIGGALVVLFVLLSLSRVALNHSRALNLDQIYVADSLIIPVPDDYFVGAVIYEETVVVASADDLFISTYGGEVVERASDVLEDGEQIFRLGMSRENGDVVIESNLGRFRCDPELYGCWPTKETPVWSDVDDIPAIVYNAVLEFKYQWGGSVDDILIALHSGRFMPFVMDSFFVLMLFFSLFGVLAWARKLHQ